MPGFKIPVDNVCGKNNGSFGPSNLTETARKHRYFFQILEPFNSGYDNILLYISKSSRPTVEFDEIAFHNAQDEIFRPGKQHWKPLELTFYEVLKGDSKQVNLTTQLIYKWWSKTMINTETSTHNEPSEYLKSGILDMVDGDGFTVWSYYLYDCWISNISPSELDYSSSEIATITVTLRYSKAKEVNASF